MIEKELISAVLTKPECLHEAYAHPEWFQSEATAMIWQTILDLQSQGEPFDAVTVMQALRPNHPKLANRVIEIANESIGVPANAASYARRIKSAWRKRKEQDIGTRLSAGEIGSGEAMNALVSLDDEQTRFEHTITESIRAALDDMERAAEHDGKIIGVPTGLADLDRILGGYHKQDLIIIAGRPKMGKTSMMLHSSGHCGVPCGLVSGEQPYNQVGMRHIASVGKVPLENLRNGRIGKREMEAVIATKNRLKHPYYIFDRGSPHINEVISTARRWKHRYDIQILFVDYLQRLRGPGDKRHEMVGENTRQLKTLARDLDIPVVALAQVKREVENRQNKRPMMSDLADSGEIEKEADLIMTLYRDEVYHENSDAPGVAEIQIVASRHGRVGTVMCDWLGEFVSFGDLTRGYTQ